MTNSCMRCGKNCNNNKFCLICSKYLEDEKRIKNIIIEYKKYKEKLKSKINKINEKIVIINEQIELWKYKNVDEFNEKRYCYICNKRVQEEHHVVPDYSFKENITINLCRNCHKMIHSIYKKDIDLSKEREKKKELKDLIDEWYNFCYLKKGIAIIEKYKKSMFEELGYKNNLNKRIEQGEISEGEARAEHQGFSKSKSK